MASSINPNNIDGAYPVAGQDNDSQGFRDNFTNTKTNFAAAAQEITDLQNKVVLKAALTGTTLNNDMGGSLLSNAQLQDMSETRVALGSVTGEQAINYAAGPYYTLTTSGSVSLVFTNWPAAGAVGRARVQITVTNVAHTMTLPASVTLGRTGIQGLNPSTNILTFGSTGTFEFEFETNNGGSTVTIFDLNRPLSYGYTDAVFFNSILSLDSSEDVANTADIDLAVTSSYFTLGGSSETATLPEGVEGMIKVLAMAGTTGGSMVVTATNPAWGGAGTITFTAAGQACTMMYINSKWFCVGNNGASFA